MRLRRASASAAPERSTVVPAAIEDDARESDVRNTRTAAAAHGPRPLARTTFHIALSMAPCAPESAGGESSTSNAMLAAEACSTIYNIHGGGLAFSHQTNERSAERLMGKAVACAI